MATIHSIPKHQKVPSDENVAHTEHPHETHTARLTRKKIDHRRILRITALVSTVASGFSGLVYEVTWHKRLSAIIGSEARATAIILAVFLGGLALGYGIFGSLSQKKSARTNIKILGYAELAIGLWALIFDDVYRAVLHTANHLPLTGPVAVIVEFLIACVLIMIPTTFMGGTLPLLTQGMSRDLNDAPRFHARVYALNTFGAFVGCLLAGFYLLPYHGLNMTLLYMAFINIGVGLALLLVAFKMVDERGPSTRAEKNDAVDGPTDINPAFAALDFNRHLPQWRSFSISWLAGFYGICIQTLLIRLIGLSMGSSEYAFSMIVSLYIGTLAMGAHGVSRYRRVSPGHLFRNQLGVVVGAMLVFVTVPYWAYVNHLLRIIFSKSEVSFYVYFISCFLAVGSVLCVMLWCMGRTLPLLFGIGKLQQKDLGKDVGALYGINTLGCVLGAIFGGYMLFFVMDLEQIFKVSMLGVVATVALGIQGIKIIEKSIFCVIATVLILTLPSWNLDHMGRGLFRIIDENSASYQGNAKFREFNFGTEHSLVAYKDAPTGTIAVYQTRNSQAQNRDKQLEQGDQKESDASVKKFASLDSRSLFVNGKSDGDAKGDYLTTILLAHLPGLFHQSRTQKAAVIGFGTGVTVGGLTMYPEIKQIDCIEISSSVYDFAKLFSAFNDSAESHPKVRWKIADAHRYFMNTSEMYDIIVSEPSNPWVTGVEKVFSQEFYTAAKKLLHTDGVYAQWFHSYSMSFQTFGLVMNTFRSVFPNVYTFSFRGDVILLGRMEEFKASDLALAEERLKNISQIGDSLKLVNIHSLADILRFEHWNPPSFYQDSGLHTLDFPRLSYEAGKDFYQGSSVNLRGSLNHWPMLPWVGNFASRTMTYHFDRSRHFANDGDREDHIKHLCGVKNLADIPLPTVFSLGQPCRSLVFRAVKEGLIKSTDLPKDHVFVDLLEKYSQESWTSQRGKKFAEGFVYFNSPLTPIPLEELSLKTAVCYQSGQENMPCIYAHALSLAVVGKLDQSQEIMDKYKDKIVEQMGAEAEASWKEVVTQSKSALQASHEGQGPVIF